MPYGGWFFGRRDNDLLCEIKENRYSEKLKLIGLSKQETLFNYLFAGSNPAVPTIFTFSQRFIDFVELRAYDMAMSYSHKSTKSNNGRRLSSKLLCCL